MDLLDKPVWLGQYRLTSRIATGGMAEVYVGRRVDPNGRFGPLVAVKRMLPHHAKDPAIVRMFLNEARVTAQIHHPNVVRIDELGQVNNEPFIAMELLEGRTWADLRTRAAEFARRMPVNIALKILHDACSGLDAAHNARDDSGQPLSLVHRDFTPENIHVGVAGDVKVIDFGIAKTVSWGSGTEPGTLKGKFFYMSPEMILAKNVDHRADIFAAGVMLYEQLCGRRPFTASSVDEVLKKIAAGSPPPPSSYDPAIPHALEAIAQKALARDPADRFQTLTNLISALESIDGAVQMATTEEVGAYVASLYPETTDERRLNIRRARAADPSVPMVETPLGNPVAKQPIENADFLKVFTPTAGLPSPLRPTAIMTTTASTTARASTRPWVVWILVAALVLGLAIAGYFTMNSRLQRATADLVADVQNTRDTSDLTHALRVLAGTPGAPTEVLKQGCQRLLDAGLFDAVLDVTESWSQSAPTAVASLLLEAEAAVGARRGKRAEAALKKAAELAPNEARVDAITAELKEQQADIASALEAWTRASKKAPSVQRYWARQGYWLSQSGRLDDAAEALSRAQKPKADPRAMAELGFVRLRQNRIDEALRLLRQSLKEKPDLLEGHYYLGTALYQRRDVSGARAAYLEADTLASEDHRPLLALCQLEAQQKSSELESVKIRIRERFPRDADSLIAQCSP